MNIVDPLIQMYMKDLLPPPRVEHEEMEAYAKEKNFPIIGPLVGRLLAQYAHLIRARWIMELGSGFGYSALWFASILPDDGKIICTEGSEENKKRALNWFSRAGVNDKIDFRIGDALSIFDSLDGEFDFIFCDIDKHEYPVAFRKAWARLRLGGIFAYDNALWSGKILDPRSDDDATRGIVECNEWVYHTPDCFPVLIPLRDGVMMCVKK